MLGDGDLRTRCARREGNPAGGQPLRRDVQVLFCLLQRGALSVEVVGSGTGVRPVENTGAVQARGNRISRQPGAGTVREIAHEEHAAIVTRKFKRDRASAVNRSGDLWRVAEDGGEPGDAALGQVLVDGVGGLETGLVARGSVVGDLNQGGGGEWRVVLRTL